MRPAIERIRDNFQSNKDSCWIWKGASSKGCPTVSDRDMQGKRKTLYVSRVVLSDKLGRALGAKEFALHKCDVPKCFNPDHLFPGTHRENMKDMSSKGRQAKGDKIPNFKVNRTEVLSLLDSGLRPVDVSKKLGVSKSLISKMKAKS